MWSAEVTMSEQSSTSEEKKKKLPYFHRTLSDEEVALIGDTAPKRIDSMEFGYADDQRKLSAGAAWNAAGTWESKNMTEWSKSKIIENLLGISVNASSFECSIKDVEATGHAEIATVRGKPKFILEFEISMNFEVVCNDDDTSYKGKLCVTDVENDQIDDIGLSTEWNGPSPAGASASRVRALLTEGSMKRQIIDKLKKFEFEFRQL